MERYQIILLHSERYGVAATEDNDSEKLIKKEDFLYECLETYRYYNFHLMDTEAKIKVGDWCIELDELVHITDECEIADDIQNKIIASTGELAFYSKNDIHSSWIPQLSKQSINLLIDYYNEDGILPNWVGVESIKAWDNVDPVKLPIKKLDSVQIKLNSQGTVDITIPKEIVYDKSEVEHLLYKYAEESGYLSCKDDYSSFNKWIEKNLTK